MLLLWFHIEARKGFRDTLHDNIKDTLEARAPPLVRILEATCLPNGCMAHIPCTMYYSMLIVGQPLE